MGIFKVKNSSNGVIPAPAPTGLDRDHPAPTGTEPTQGIICFNLSFYP
jgi:hypothetical protein